MRIALVTESFLPDVNGVANSVARTAEHLLNRGHEPRRRWPVDCRWWPRRPAARWTWWTMGGFTEAIAELAASPDLRHEFGSAGRTAIEGRSWSAVGDELIGYYRAALAPVDRTLQVAA